MARTSKTVKVEIPVEEIINRATDEAVRSLSFTIERNVREFLYRNNILYSDIMKQVIENAAHELAKTGMPKDGLPKDVREVR